MLAPHSGYPEEPVATMSKHHTTAVREGSWASVHTPPPENEQMGKPRPCEKETPRVNRQQQDVEVLRMHTGPGSRPLPPARHETWKPRAALQLVYGQHRLRSLRSAFTHSTPHNTHFCWEASAKVSCFSREMPNRSATFSEVILEDKSSSGRVRQPGPGLGVGPALEDRKASPCTDTVMMAQGVQGHRQGLSQVPTSSNTGDQKRGAHRALGQLLLRLRKTALMWEMRTPTSPLGRSHPSFLLTVGGPHLHPGNPEPQRGLLA